MFDTRARMTPKGRSICEFAPSHQTIPLHPHPNVNYARHTAPWQSEQPPSEQRRRRLRDATAAFVNCSQARDPGRRSLEPHRPSASAAQHMPRTRAGALACPPARPHPLPAPPTAARPGSVQPSPAGIRTAGTHPTPPRPAARSRSCCTSTRAVAPACTACRRAGGRRSR